MLDAIDELEEEGTSDWEQQLAPVIDPLVALAERAEDYDAFLEGLPKLLEEMDASEVIKSLALQAFKARGLGDATDEV